MKVSTPSRAAAELSYVERILFENFFPENLLKNWSIIFGIGALNLSFTTALAK